MEFKFNLKKVKDDQKRKGKEPFSKLWSGEVILDIPSADDRMKLLKELKVNVDEDGNVIAGDSKLDQGIKILSLFKDKLKKMKIVHNETKQEFTCAKELEMYEEGQELMGLLGGKIIGGPKLGEAFPVN